MKRSIFFVFAASLVLAGFLFAADVSVAAENYNSSKSNTATAIQNAGVGQEDIDRILGEFAVSETEVLIDEELLRTRLAEIGISEDRIREALENLRASYFAELDESVIPQELGVGAPRVLPGNPLYFFKDAGRGIRSLFTFSPERKAELSLRFSNEKILEAEKLSEQGKTTRLAAHLKNYEKDLERTEVFFDKFEEKKPELAQKFAEKSLNNQLKHQILFGKFEKQANAETLSGIREIRDKVLSRTGELVGTIDDPEKIKEAVSQALAEKGSAFKPLRNLEILKAVEEKVPERALQAIHQAQENALDRFKTQFEAMNDDARATLGDYIENAGGNETLYAKVFDQLKFSGIEKKANDDILAAKEKLFSRMNERAKEAAKKNPELAKQFFSNLKAGSVDDLRVLNDIERNIDPALTSHIIEVRAEATEKFQERFEALDPQKQKEFAKNIAQRFPDVKQIEVFEGLEKTLPEEKRETTQGLRQEVVTAIKERVEKTPDPQKRQAELRTVIGDSPEHIEIIKGIRGALDKKAGDELFTEQTKQFSERIRYINDPGQLKIFEQKINENPELRSTVQRVQPEFFTTLKQKEQETRQGVDEGQAKIRIDETERRLGELIQKAESAFSALDAETKEKYSAKAKGVFENSRAHLDRAKESFAQKQFGEAFGEATSALHVLNSVEELISSVFRIQERASQPPTPAPKEKSVLEERKDEGRSSPTPKASEERSILPSPSPVKPSPLISPIPIPSPEAVLCTQEYAPVCGTDGKTYSNRCTAEKQNRTAVAHESECKTSTACPFDRNPVCGTNKTTYLNECFAKEAGATIQYAGDCKTAAAPVLKDRFPLSGPIGTKVTVQGTGFTPAKNTIHFGSGIIPDLPSDDGNSLIFSIPEDQVPACAHTEPRCLLPAPYGPVKPGNVYYISVTNENGKGNVLPFTVTEPTKTAPPSISPQ